MSIKDYFLSRRVGNAMMSPGAILLAGLGASIGILLGLGLFGAVIGGVLGWSSKVLYSAFSTPGLPSINDSFDSHKLTGSWKVFFRDAQEARIRFDSVIGRAESGPLKDRLESIGSKLDDGLKQAWQLAVHGQQMQEATKDIPIYQVQKELDAYKSADSLNPTMARTKQALEAQLEAARRVDAVMQQSHDNLRLINAHLDEAVARGVELSLTANDPSDLISLDDDVSDVLDEMEALQQALRTTM